jgi:hypothetical protein
VIVRDFCGEVIATKSLTIQTKTRTSNWGSYGAIYALRAATENLSSYGHLIDDTRWLLQLFRTTEVRHVKRNANKATHRLAREAVKNCGDNIWMEETPPCISDTIALERVALVI